MKCPNCIGEDLPLVDRLDGTAAAYSCAVCGFQSAPNYLRVRKLWAFLSVDEHNQEGVCAFSSGRGPVPMIAADEDRLASLKELAARIAKNSGVKVKLVEFSSRRDVEVYS